MFNNLSIEILLEIYSYLSPEAIRNTTLVNKELNTISSKDLAIDKTINSFWRSKFIQHFPYDFTQKDTHGKFNWYAEFRNCYEATYKDLPLSTRKLFSIVKENDFESLKKIPNLRLDVLDSKDSNGISLFELVTIYDYQKIQDHFYLCAQTYYAKNKFTLDTSKKDELGRTILYWAITLRQNLEQILMLLDEGSTLDETYKRCFAGNPIHLAAKAGLIDVVKAFIEKNPLLLNRTDFNNQSPLLWASSEGHVEIAEYLLKKGANLEFATTTPRPTHSANGRTALYWATTKGHHKMVNLLAKAGAITTTALGDKQFQPIHKAVFLGKLDLVRVLIEHNPDLLEEMDIDGHTPLYLAVGRGRADITDYLISKGANVNVFPTSKDHEGKGPLYWATEKGNCQIVNSLLKAGAIIKSSEKIAHPIHIAAKNGNLDIVKTLIDYYPDLIENKDHFGQTPLLWAASQGHIEMVDYLIERKADLNMASFNPGHKYHGKTPIYWATEAGHSKVVNSLAKAGAITTTALGEGKFQPIHIAAYKGNLDLLKALIENDLKLLDERDAFGQTPLLLAAEKGHTDSVDYLISKSADLNAVNSEGKTALYLATVGNYSAMVKLLLKAGAMATVFVSDHKLQPIHVAAQKGNSDLVEIFIEHNPDLLEEKDVFQQTPLLLASAKGHTKIVDYLISKRANLNVASFLPTNINNGKSSLYWATERGHYEVVNSLAKAGAMTTLDINPKFLQPIFIAIQKNRFDLVQTLIENDPQLIIYQDKFGQTPLHWAVAEGRVDMVRFLINQDADLNALAANNLAPINLAAQSGFNEIVNLLLKAGAKTNLPVPIDQSNLNNDVRGKIKLLNYIPQRKTEALYKNSFSFFGYKKHFGYSKQEKISAAEALAAVKLFDADVKLLDKYQGELNNGELNTINKMIL